MLPSSCLSLAAPTSSVDWPQAINIAATVVIAITAFFQARFASRLSKYASDANRLQQKIEQSRTHVEAVPTLVQDGINAFGLLIANLSAIGVWIENATLHVLDAEIDGKPCWIDPVRAVVPPYGTFDAGTGMHSQLLNFAAARGKWTRIVALNQSWTYEFFVTVSVRAAGQSKIFATDICRKTNGGDRSPGSFFVVGPVPEGLLAKALK